MSFKNQPGFGKLYDYDLQQDAIEREERSMRREAQVMDAHRPPPATWAPTVIDPSQIEAPADVARRLLSVYEGWNWALDAWELFQKMGALSGALEQAKALAGNGADPDLEGWCTDQLAVLKPALNALRRVQDCAS